MNAFLWIWCFLEVNCYPVHKDILRRGSLEQSNQMLYQNKVRDFALITTFNISNAIKENELLQSNDNSMKINIMKIKTELKCVEINKLNTINFKRNIIEGQSRHMPNFEKLLVSNQSKVGNTKSLVHKVIKMDTQKQNINEKPSVHKYFNEICRKSRLKREVPHMLLLTSMINNENIFNEVSSKQQIKRCKHNRKNMSTEYKQRDAKVILLKNYNKKKSNKYHLLNSNKFEKNINTKEKNDNKKNYYKSTRANTADVSDYVKPTIHLTSRKIQHNFASENDFNYLHLDQSHQTHIDNISPILTNKTELYSENESKFKSEQSIPVITLNQNLHTIKKINNTSNELNLRSSPTDTLAQRQNEYLQTKRTNQLINNKASQKVEHESNTDLLNDEKDGENKEFTDANKYHQFKAYVDKQHVFYPINGINDQSQENVTDQIFSSSGNLSADKRTNISKPVIFISVPLKSYYSGNKLLTLQTYGETSDENIQNDPKIKINDLQIIKPDNSSENNIPQIIVINDTHKLAYDHHLEFVNNSKKLNKRGGILYNENNSHGTIDTNNSIKGDSQSTTNSNVPQYEIKQTTGIHTINPIMSKNVTLEVISSDEKTNHIQSTRQSEKTEESSKRSMLPSSLTKYETILNTDNSNLNLPYFSISNQKSKCIEVKNYINENVTETDTYYIQNEENDNSHKSNDSPATFNKLSHNPDGYGNLKLRNSYEHEINENNQSQGKQIKKLTSAPENINSTFEHHYLQIGNGTLNYTFNEPEILPDVYKVKHSIDELTKGQQLTCGNRNTGSLLLTNENGTKNISSFENNPAEETNEQSLNNTGNYDKNSSHITKKDDQINQFKNDTLATYLDVLNANVESKINTNNTEKNKRNTFNYISNLFNTLKSDSNSEQNFTNKITREIFLQNETNSTYSNENIQNVSLAYNQKKINNSERCATQIQEKNNRFFEHFASKLKTQDEIFGKRNEILEAKNKMEMESSTSYEKNVIMPMTNQNETDDLLLENNISDFKKDKILLQTINNSMISISNKTKGKIVKDESYEENFLYDEQFNFLNCQSNCTSNNQSHTCLEATFFKSTISPDIKKSFKNLQTRENYNPTIYDESESINTVVESTSANQPIFTLLKEGTDAEQQVNGSLNYFQINYNNNNMIFSDKCNQSTVETDKYPQPYLNIRDMSDDVLKSNVVKSFVLNSNNCSGFMKQSPLIDKNINSMSNALSLNNNESISDGNYNILTSFEENYNATDVFNNVYKIKPTNTSSAVKINPYESQAFTTENGRRVSDHRKLTNQSETIIKISVDENYGHEKHTSNEHILFNENVLEETNILHNNTLNGKRKTITELAALESIVIHPKPSSNEFSAVNVTNNVKPTCLSHHWNNNKNIFLNLLPHHSNQSSNEMKKSLVEENFDQQNQKDIWSDLSIYNVTTIDLQDNHSEILNDTTTEINFADTKHETLNYAPPEKNNSFNQISFLVNKSEKNYLGREFYADNYFPSLQETETDLVSQSLKSKSDKISLITNGKNKFYSFEDPVFIFNHTNSDRNDSNFISLEAKLYVNNTPNFYRVPSMDLKGMDTVNNSNFFKLNLTEPNYKHQSKMWDILPDVNDEVDTEEIQYNENKNDKQNKNSPQLNNNFKSNKSVETKISGNIVVHNNVSLLQSYSSNNIPERNNKTTGNLNLHEIINNLTQGNDELTDITIQNKNIPTNTIPTDYHDNFTKKSIPKGGILPNLHEKRNIKYDWSQLGSDKELIYNSKNTMEDYTLSNSQSMMIMPANSIPISNANNIIQISSDFRNGTDEVSVFQDTSDQLQTPFTYNESSPITFIGDLYMISKTSPQNSSETIYGKNQLKNSLILLNHDFQIPLLIKPNTNFTDAEALQPLGLGKNNDTPDGKIQRRMNSEINNANNTEKILLIKAIIDAKIQNPNHNSPANKYFQSTVNSSQINKDIFNSLTSQPINNAAFNVRNTVQNQYVKPITNANNIDVKSKENISNEIQQRLPMANKILSSNNKHGILFTHNGETNQHIPKRNPIRITNPPQKYTKKTNFKHNKSKSKYEIIKNIIVWFHDKNKVVEQR